MKRPRDTRDAPVGKGRRYPFCVMMSLSMPRGPSVVRTASATTCAVRMRAGFCESAQVCTDAPYLAGSDVANELANALARVGSFPQDDDARLLHTAPPPIVTGPAPKGRARMAGKRQGGGGRHAYRQHARRHSPLRHGQEASRVKVEDRRKKAKATESREVGPRVCLFRDAWETEPNISVGRC
jgi:hypothetical protein